MMTIGGFAATSASSVSCFVYMSEFLTEKQVVLMTTVWCFNFANGIIIITFYFDVISQHYIYICTLGALLTTVAYFGTFWTPESPIWLLKSGRTLEA